jgi:CMP/dCMP kinase
MNRGFSVAIDGPVASGKGTLAESLAERIGGYFINTGGMYRALALYCIENEINIDSEAEVSKYLSEIRVELDGERVFLNGKDISSRIKEPDISAISATLASYGSVRRDLARRQSEISEKLISEGKAVIVEGRDIGIRVLPNADLKIFLTADEEIRARRRFEQYQEKGLEKSFEDVLQETKDRDHKDTTRETDPLPSNPEELGYWVLDDSGQSEEETIETVMTELRKRGLING